MPACYWKWRAATAAAQRWYDLMRVRSSGLAARVGRLSGGNQQKVVLGKALMTVATAPPVNAEKISTKACSR